MIWQQTIENHGGECLAVYEASGNTWIRNFEFKQLHILPNRVFIRPIARDIVRGNDVCIVKCNCLSFAKVVFISS